MKFTYPNRFRNHPAVLGENNSNLTRIVQIIAEAVAAEVFEQYPDCAVRLKTILSQVQVSVLTTTLEGFHLLIFSVRTPYTLKKRCFNVYATSITLGR